MNSRPGGPAADGEEPAPLLGTAPTRRPSRMAGLSFTPARVAQVVGIVVLVVLGAALPYLSMPYIARTAELAQWSSSLFPSATFIRGVDPLWLPGYEPGPANDQIQLALTVFNLGPGFQQIGAVVGVLFCAALLSDEINKFFWWPLHLGSWLLAVAPVLLLVGQRMLRAAEVDVTVHVGWLPLSLAGVLGLVATFRAHSRIDTYASI